MIDNILEKLTIWTKLHKDVIIVTIFAQIEISKTDNPIVWNEYKKTIVNEEARILSDLHEQECYFWRAMSSDDICARMSYCRG